MCASQLRFNIMEMEMETAATNCNGNGSISKKVLLTDILSASADTHHVPSNYIRPISDRPNLTNVLHLPQHSIPLVDLNHLHSSPQLRSLVVKQIGLACQHHGFFQVKNHGIPKSMIDNMLDLGRQFFRLPESERLKNYSDDPLKTTRLSTSFNVRTEKVSNWRDFLRLHCYPLDKFVHEWPSNPPSFRKDVAEYCTSVRRLALGLIEAISESLGLERDYIERQLGEQAQHMAFNYYPKCPQPGLTYGLPGHTDLNLITILLHDHVGGLQVLGRNGKWIAVNPIPDTFIINIGDQIQVLSNDRYKSVVHRAVVNSEQERISIPTFYCPSPDAVIGPAPQLVDQDHPPVYNPLTYQDYYEKFWNRGLASENCLDMFLASSSTNSI